MKSLLTHLVEKSLLADRDALKEAVVGVEVFGRTPGYDPKVDGIVRVEAHRLRARLKLYYEQNESFNGMRFLLEKGSYVVAFQTTAPEPEPEPPPPPAPQPRPRERDFGAWVVGFVIVIGFIVLFSTRSNDNSRFNPNLRRITADTGLTTEPVLSRDGKVVIYASDRNGDGTLQLWRHPLEGGPPVQLTRSAQDNHDPSISFADRFIVFRSEREGGGIYRMPSEGGVAELLVRDGRRPRSSPDGQWVLYFVQDERFAPARIYIVNSGGGEPRRLAASFADAHNPIWSVDGKAILFCGTRVSRDPSQEHDWWVIPFPDGEPVKTDAFATFDRYKGAVGGRLRVRGDQLGAPQDWVDDVVWFVAASNDRDSLWRIPIHRNYRIDSPPQPVTSGTAAETNVSVRGGHAVFASGTQSVDIVEVKADTRIGRTTGPLQRLTMHPGVELQPKLSDDGRSLAFTSDRDGRRRVYLLDIPSGKEQAVDASPGQQDHPLFSVDGTHLAWLSVEAVEMRIYAMDLATRRTEVLHQDAGAPTSWSSDGRYMLFEPGSLIPYVGLLDLRQKSKEALLRRSDWGLRSAVLSPDNRWVAFQVDQGMTARKIMVAPFLPGGQVPPERWVDISRGSNADFLPAWGPDGNLLYFISERDGTRSVWAQRLDATTKRPLGESFAVVPMREARRTLLRNYRIGLDRIGLTVTPTRLVFSMDESTSNVWAADVK